RVRPTQVSTKPLWAIQQVAELPVPGRGYDVFVLCGVCKLYPARAWKSGHSCSKTVDETSISEETRLLDRSAPILLMALVKDLVELGIFLVGVVIDVQVPSCRCSGLFPPRSIWVYTVVRPNLADERVHALLSGRCPLLKVLCERGIIV